MSSAIAEIETDTSVLVDGEDEDLSRLLEIESQIEQKQGIGQRIYAEIGILLEEIKAKGLWCKRQRASGESYESFVDYCVGEWAIEKRRANQLIVMGKFVKNLAAADDGSGTTVPKIPKSERHIRPLLRLSDDDQVKVYQKAVEDLPDGEDITESYIAEKVREFHDQTLKKIVEEAPPEIKRILDKPKPEAVEQSQEQPLIDSTIDVKDESDDTELIENTPSTDDVAPPRVRGILSKIRALPTPEQPYDFAIADARNFAEMASTAIDELTRQIKKGGRLALFCNPLESYEIAASAVTYGYTLEHSLVHPKEVDPEYKGDQLWPIGHEVILILMYGTESKEQRNSDRSVERVLQLLGEMAGTTWYGPVQSMTQQLLTAYCKVGDRVLCPTAGKHFVRESLDYGCDVTYLTADPEKLAWYQEKFGAS